MDTCGTGGDASGTFNISTATALCVAGAGVRVAKHGNRSVSSKCGSADVVEALGVNITLPPARMAACLEQVGIAFLFAPAMHSAMKYVQPARRELRLPTVFNLLGPLTNPANASVQVVGVYSADLVEKLAEALAMLGLRRALVVHGNDGLDEITITGPTRVAEMRDGSVRAYEVTPEEFGLKRAPLEAISGGDVAGKRRHHPRHPRREEVRAARCRAAECRRGAGRRRKRGHHAGRHSTGRVFARFRRRSRQAGRAGALHQQIIMASRLTLKLFDVRLHARALGCRSGKAAMALGTAKPAAELSRLERARRVAAAFPLRLLRLSTPEPCRHRFGRARAALPASTPARNSNCT